MVVRGAPRPAATVWYQMSTKFSLPVRGIVARAQRERRTIETRLGDGLELRAGVRKAAFSLKFRDRRTGRQERLTLGYYPSIGLAEARRRAKEEQARIADPKVLANPARERRDISAMSTFKELADLRLADERLAERTTAFYRWCRETYAFPRIGGMAAADVRTDDIVTIVDTVAKRAPATATGCKPRSRRSSRGRCRNASSPPILQEALLAEPLTCHETASCGIASFGSSSRGFALIVSTRRRISPSSCISCS